MHAIDRCRNSELKRQTKKRKTEIVELSFPKLLGFDFMRKWVRGLDERPNESSDERVFISHDDKFQREL